MKHLNSKEITAKEEKLFLKKDTDGAAGVCGKGYNLCQRQENEILEII